MKKLTTIAMTILLTVPVIAVAADNDAAVTDNDQAKIAASYQQGDDPIDAAAPVTQSVTAPDLQAQTSPAAPALDDAATIAKPADTAPASASTDKIADNLSQKINALQSNINQLQQQGDQVRQQIAEIQYAVYGLAGLLVLVALLSLMRRRKKPVQVQAPAHLVAAAASDSQQEYDFMGSSEGIPAKLDLARAYIAMEDVSSARDTLIEILTEGNEEQRLEAKSLLNKIK